MPETMRGRASAGMPGRSHDPRPCPRRDDDGGCPAGLLVSLDKERPCRIIEQKHLLTNEPDTGAGQDGVPADWREPGRKSPSGNPG